MAINTIEQLHALAQSPYDLRQIRKLAGLRDTVSEDVTIASTQEWKVIKSEDDQVQLVDRNGKVVANMTAETWDELTKNETDRQSLGEEKETPSSVERDVLGEIDDEAHFLRSELYKIAKYAAKLCKELKDLDDVDFPAWWQAKIVRASQTMSEAKHYFEFELAASKGKDSAQDAVKDL